MTTYLDISKIRRDGGTQPRVGTNVTVAEEYALAMSEGDEFPPVTVFFDGSNYWLADGFHRVVGAEGAGLLEINADVRQGSLRNAVLYSVGANAAHGARRTNEDKRQAVSRLLNDPEWAQWSDREIARQCRVGNKFVGDVRKAICVPNTDNIFQPLEDKPKRKVTRNGTTYTQNTANIGSAKPGYVRNETGGYTKEGFEPPDPQMTYTDTSTGEVLHHPWSKEKQESRREISGVTLDLLDNLKWITALTKEQVGDKVLPRYREEVDGLLWRAAAHLRNLVDERNQPHDTQEESIKHSN